MFKMLLGNLLFIGLIFGWYLYTDGDRNLLVAGTILGFSCYISGIFMGYILHTPPARRAASARPTVEVSSLEAIEKNPEPEHLPASVSALEETTEHRSEAEPATEAAIADDCHSDTLPLTVQPAATSSAQN